MTAAGAEPKPITLVSAALATLCAVFWGGLAVAVRYTQDELPPLGTAGLRFGIATALLAGWARFQGTPLVLRPGQWWAVVPVGVLLFLQIGSFHLGLTRTNSAHASVLIGSNPVFVAVVAHFALHNDRLSVAKLLGLVVATAGLLAVVAGSVQSTGTHEHGGDAVTLAGDAIILGSSFLISVNTIFTKRALASIEVTTLLFWSNLIATALFLSTSMICEGPASYHFGAASLWGLAYQGVIVAWFCFLLWTALLHRHRASQLAVFGFAQPLCGMVFGAWFRGDPLTNWLLIGGLAVALGIVLVTRADTA